MTTGPVPPTTTPPTVAHDSMRCNYGVDGQPCGMCAWANRVARWRVEQSAAAIRARRAALLERVDIYSPTEGAVALAEAHLVDEAWYRHLPNNTMQDATVLELAGRIESTIGGYVDHRQKESDQCD